MKKSDRECHTTAPVQLKRPMGRKRDQADSRVGQSAISALIEESSFGESSSTK